jgi:hypothetical protein
MRTMRETAVVLASTATIVLIAIYAMRVKRHLDREAEALVDWLRDYEEQIGFPKLPVKSELRELDVARLLQRAAENHAGVPAEDDPILRVTVDEFIERAVTNNLPIDRPGEWADDYKSTLDQAYQFEDPPPDPPARRPLHRASMVDPKQEGQRGLKHPMTRMLCLKCSNRWDCWVTEDGQAEDPRDLLCHCGGTVVIALPEDQP